MNLDEYESIGPHSFALYVNDSNITYFDSFGVDPNPKEIINLIGDKCVDIFVLDLLISC